jgi:hypothetical protein
MLRGVRYWDDSRMTAGASWEEEIDQALSDAHAFVVVVTPASKSCVRVNFEIGVAAGRSLQSPLPILPVLAGDARPEDIPPVIRDRFALDSRSMKASDIAAKIKDALSSNRAEEIA